MLVNLWNVLNGKKTYLVVAVYLALVALVKLGGIDIPGFAVGQDWITPVLVALGVGTARSALNKIGQ